MTKPIYQERTDDRTTPARLQLVMRVVALEQSIMQGVDALEAVHEFKLEVLEPRLRELYDWFCQSSEEGYPMLYSIDVCHAFEVSKEDAATMLKALVDIGLLERIEERTKTGRRYLYGLPGIAEDWQQ